MSLSDALFTGVVSLRGVTSFTPVVQEYEVMRSGSQRGGNVYIADGYGYIKDHLRNKRLSLRCRHSKSRGCKGRALIDCKTDTFVLRTPHNSCDI